MTNRAHKLYAVVYSWAGRCGVAGVSHSRGKAVALADELLARALASKRQRYHVEVQAVPSGRLDRTFLD
jgi:hypothetical protein